MASYPWSKLPTTDYPDIVTQQPIRYRHAMKFLLPFTKKIHRESARRGKKCETWSGVRRAIKAWRAADKPGGGGGGDGRGMKGFVWSEDWIALGPNDQVTWRGWGTGRGGGGGGGAGNTDGVQGCQVWGSLDKALGRVPTAQGKTGKTGKMAKINPCQGKHRNFGKFAKTRGIWFAQVVISLILKLKDISVFAAKISIFRRIWIRQFCVCNSHKSHRLAQGKFAVGQGKHREFENTIWVGTLHWH